MFSYKNYDNIKDSILYFIILLLPLFLILGNGITNSALAIVFIIYIIECFRNKKILFNNTFEFKIFVIFYIYLIFNSFISNNIESSLVRTTGYIKYFIFVLVYLDFFKIYKKYLKVGIVWILIIVLLNFDIIYQSIFGKDIFGYDTRNYARNSGFFFDELIAGGYLLGLSFLSFSLINYNNRIKFSYLFILLCLLACILSGERSNTIKFLIIFFLFSLLILNINPKNIKKYLLIFIISIISISSIVYYKSEQLKIRYFETISFSSNNNLSLVDQYLTSAYGAHTLSAYFVFKENYLLGVGNKNFRFECNYVEDKVRKVQTEIDQSNINLPSGCSTHPHQIYNELFSEHGIVGTILLITLILILIINRLKNRNLSKLNIVSLLYLIVVFIPILPAGSFFTTFNSTLFWINFLFFLLNEKIKS